MYKLTLINVVATFALAAVLANTPVGASLAGTAVMADNASAADSASLLRMDRTQLAAAYPALSKYELDRLVFRIADRLSMVGVH